MRLKWFVMPLASFVFVSLLSAQVGQPKQGRRCRQGESLFAVRRVSRSGQRRSKVGPGLKGIFKRAKLSNGKPMNEPNVRAIVESGGNGMPPYKQMLTPAEKDAVSGPEPAPPWGT